MQTRTKLRDQFMLNIARIMSFSVLLMVSTAGSAAEVSLIEKMQSLQYFTHKAGLSLNAANEPLLDFYLHEIEEVVEVLEGLPKYKDIIVGPLVKSMLVPPFHALEEAVDKSDLPAAKVAFDRMLESCNQCHEATGRGYLRVEMNNSNPYPQSFEVPKPVR